MDVYPGDATDGNYFDPFDGEYPYGSLDANPYDPPYGEGTDPDGTTGYYDAEIIPDQDGHSMSVEVCEPEPVVPATPDEWVTPDNPMPDDPRYHLFANSNGLGTYARHAPTIQEQREDASRTDTIQYWRSTQGIGDDRSYDGSFVPGELVTVTEHEALDMLTEFLDTAIVELPASDDYYASKLIERAHTIKNHLRYMGARQFDEATAGVAGLWQQFLGDHPQHQLYVPVGMVRMGDDTIKKSDQRVFDGVAAHLEPHELARVVTDVNDIKSPRRTLRVLLDDWSKSGAQLESGYRHSSAALARRFRFRGYGMDTEVHLLIASDRQLANPTIYARGIHVNVPLRAYFHGGYDYSVNKATSGPLVTGSHSSVDLNFEDTLRHMAEIMNSLHPDRPTYIPPPANIVRQP